MNCAFDRGFKTLNTVSVVVGSVLAVFHRILQVLLICFGMILFYFVCLFFFRSGINPLRNCTPWSFWASLRWWDLFLHSLKFQMYFPSVTSVYANRICFSYFKKSAGFLNDKGFNKPKIIFQNFLSNLNTLSLFSWITNCSCPSWNESFLNFVHFQENFFCLNNNHT